MNNTEGTKVVTGKVVLNHTNLFEPFSYNGSKPKYSATIIIPKDDVDTLEKIKTAIETAIKIGKFDNQETFDRSTLKLPLRDGDVEYPFNELYENCYFLTASSMIPPAVVDEGLRRNFGAHKVSSGDYAKVSIDFVPYNFNENIGVSCKLYSVQTLNQKSRLFELRPAPEDDFGKEE